MRVREWPTRRLPARVRCKAGVGGSPLVGSRGGSHVQDRVQVAFGGARCSKATNEPIVHEYMRFGALKTHEKVDSRTGSLESHAVPWIEARSKDLRVRNLFKKRLDDTPAFLGVG